MPESREKPYCLFIGMPVEIADQAAIHRVIAPAKETMPDLRWLDPLTWHVTLAFIGHVTAAIKERLLQALAQLKITTSPVLSLKIQEWVQWPSKQPRVLALRLMDDKNLLALRQTVVDVISQLGVTIDRQNFVPHISVARAAYGVSAAHDFNIDLQHLSVDAPANIQLKQLRLWHSERGQQAAHYHVLFSRAL